MRIILRLLQFIACESSIILDRKRDQWLYSVQIKRQKKGRVMLFV